MPPPALVTVTLNAPVVVVVDNPKALLGWHLISDGASDGPGHLLDHVLRCRTMVTV